MNYPASQTIEKLGLNPMGGFATQPDIFALNFQDYGRLAQQRAAVATDAYYDPGIEGSCSLTEFVDGVIMTYDPLDSISEYFKTVSTGDWRPIREMRTKGRPSLTGVGAICCGIRPQATTGNRGLLQMNRVAIGTAIEICDITKWQSASSAYSINLEKEAVEDRMEAIQDVSSIMAIRGGYGLPGIVGSDLWPAAWLPNPISAMNTTGEQVMKTILNLVRTLAATTVPKGGYTLALPPAAYMSLMRPFSGQFPSSIMSALMGTCSCAIPGMLPGVITKIVRMPQLNCAAPGKGTGDMGLLYVDEYIEWDLPVPYQTIEPERCGLIYIGAMIALVGEVFQRRQGHALKIFNV
jgi:hypothetical protein